MLNHHRADGKTLLFNTLKFMNFKAVFKAEFLEPNS